MGIDDYGVFGSIDRHKRPLTPSALMGAVGCMR